MKGNLLKTLLVSALAIGAWEGVSADTGTAVVKMTYISGQPGEQDTSYGEIATGETARTGYNKISGGKVDLGFAAWNCNWITYIQVDASQITGTITSAKLSMDVSGSTDSKRNCSYGVGYNSSAWSSGLTWNSADRSITTVGSTVSSSSASASSFVNREIDITAALKNDEDKIVTLLVYETAAAGGYVKNPAVTIEYAAADAKTGTMTIHFVNKDTNEEIKESRQETLAEGTVCSVTEEDQKNIFAADGKKYIYISDDAESKTVSADSNTDVYVYFREAATYNYTLKSNIDGFSYNGTTLEGENVKVAYPRYLLQDGTLYEASATNKEYNLSFDVTEDNLVKTLNYKATSYKNVVYFKEAEDIEGLTASSSSNANIRCSMSKGAYAAEDTEITKLAAGKYKLTAIVWGNAGVTMNFNAGDNQIGAFTTKGYIDIQSSKDFEVSKYTPILFMKGGDSGKVIDLLFIQKTGNVAAETATITEAGFATYVPSNNVEAPENVDVYTAKVTDGKVNLTKVDAGTVLCGDAGYILAGAAGDYEFTVTDAAATLPSADLKAATQDVVADGTQYVLAQQDGKVGFSKVETGTTIAAGKAYLQVSADQAQAKAFLAIGGSTTGIEGVETATADSDVYYSISGVKTTKPGKGLYIHNGKKVIVK